jgi:alpha-N-acetylglucosamine transferase
MTSTPRKLNAFATLITNDPYLPGALALAHSLHSTSTPHHVIALVPPNVLSSATISQLYRAFDRVVYVPSIMRSGKDGEGVESDKVNLRLLGRPELDVTFTKLHVFNPQVIDGEGVTYAKVCFLDADAFVIRNVDQVFDFIDDQGSASDDDSDDDNHVGDRVQGRGGVVFAAAADVGWPDMFNSGVFVARPSKRIFDELVQEAGKTGSFDGEYSS